MKQNASVKKVGANNFGAYGWLTVFFGFLLYTIGSGVVTDFLNVSVAAISGRTGWNSALMLTMSSVAGWITIVTSMLAGQLVKKFGARLVMTISIVAMAVITFFLGSTNSFPIYCVIVILMATCEVTQNGMAMQTIVANWFPKKKGLVMGWTTMGMMCSITLFLPLFNKLISVMGIANAYRVVAGIVLAIGIGAWFCLRNSPWERGAAPDNDPNTTKEMMTEMAAKSAEFAKTSPFTIKKLLKTKQVWQISVTMGLAMMVATGVMSQFVPRMISMGYDVGQAVGILSMVGIIAAPCSYIWGYIDLKLGTKKVTTILMIWFLVTVLIAVFAGSNLIGIYISVFGMAAALGGNGNMLTSYTASVFGPNDFINANRVIYPIFNILRTSAFAITGISAALSGGYTLTFLLFAGCLLISVIISLFAKDTLIGRT